MKAPFHSRQGEEYIHVIGGRGIFRTHKMEVTAESDAILRFEPEEEHQHENRWGTRLEFIFVYSNPYDIQILRDRWVSVQ